MAFLPPLAVSNGRSVPFVSQRSFSSRHRSGRPVDHAINRRFRYTVLSTIRACEESQYLKKFTIVKTVLPADSDYSFALWHGGYLRWMEEARVRYLEFRNLKYQDLIEQHRTELVVRDATVRYISPAVLGDDIEVSIQMQNPAGKVRIVIESEFVRLSDQKLCARGQVTVVPINSDSRKVCRVWPDVLRQALSPASVP